MALQQVGALWRKKKGNGEEYLAGQINATGSVLIFKNIRKSSALQPDFNVVQADGPAEYPSVHPFALGPDGQPQQ